MSITRIGVGKRMSAAVVHGDTVYVAGQVANANAGAQVPGSKVVKNGDTFTAHKDEATPFQETMTRLGIPPEQLRERCHEARCAFYGIPSILRRAGDRQANCRNPRRAGLYFLMNFLLRCEIRLKRGLPLGVRDGRPRATRPGVIRHQVDVTDLIVDLFQPNEKAKGYIKELAKHPPVPPEVLAKHKDK